MNWIRSTSRRALAVAAGAALLATLGVANPASATPDGASSTRSFQAPVTPVAPVQDTPYGGFADSELLALRLADLTDVSNEGLLLLIPQLLDALGLGGTGLVDIGLVHSEATADSEGLPGDPDLRTHSRAANLDRASVSDIIDLASLLSEVEQTAPPDNPTPLTEALIDINPDQILGLLALELAPAEVQSRWAGDNACVSSEEPLAYAQNEVTDATVLPAIEEGLVDTNNDQGAVALRSELSLPSIDGPGLDPRAVQAESSTQVASVELLGGAIQIGVAQPPVLTASVTGHAGGASVEYNEPLLTVNGEEVIGAVDLMPILGPDGLGGVLDTVLDLIETLGLGETSLLLTTGQLENETEAADGTFASGDASLLRLVLRVAGLELVDLAIMPLHAEANVAAGGLDCGIDNPLESLHKAPSSAVVFPGSTFEYIITVPNDSTECTLTNVRVVDVITGPAGTSIVDTNPDATSITPADNGATHTLVWNDVGPIPPNDNTRTLEIKVQVPPTATEGQTYSDFVTVTADCDGREVENDTQVVDIPRVVSPPDTGCRVEDSNKTESHIEVRPGDQFNYLINVFNSGGENCTGVTITDTLDPRVTFVRCTDGCTVSPDGRTVTWNLGTVTPGSGNTLALTVQVNPDATGNLPDVAIINSDQRPPHQVSTPGPVVGDDRIPAPLNPAGFTRLARTGPSTMPWLIASALGIAALGLQRLRRRVGEV